MLQSTIQDIRARNADADPDEIQRIVDEALSEVRAERRAKGKAGGGLLPLSELFVATLSRVNWGRRLCAVFVLCAAMAIAVPAQTFTTLHRFDGTDGNGPSAALVRATNGDL